MDDCLFSQFKRANPQASDILVLLQCKSMEFLFSHQEVLKKFINE